MTRATRAYVIVGLAALTVILACLGDILWQGGLA
jgi:uncharacterized membrane protein YuzA (DUF378 family)